MLGGTGRWLACSIQRACVCCLLVLVLLSNLLLSNCIYTVCVCDKLWLVSM